MTRYSFHILISFSVLLNKLRRPTLHKHRLKELVRSLLVMYEKVLKFFFVKVNKFQLPKK